MYSARDDARLRAPGCPIRKSPDQSLFGGSPKLFAAYHVLHRWLAPRHSPCALSSLTIQRVSHTQDCTLTEDTYYSVVKDQLGTLLPLRVKQGPKLYLSANQTQLINLANRNLAAQAEATGFWMHSQKRKAIVTHPNLNSSPLPGKFTRTFWWSGPGLNRQPPACKADALPIELPPRPGSGGPR
jgi:hypothetical protein